MREFKILFFLSKTLLCGTFPCVKTKKKTIIESKIQTTGQHAHMKTLLNKPETVLDRKYSQYVP